MSLDLENDHTPLESKDQLLEYFRTGIKKPEQRAVGTEQ